VTTTTTASPGGSTSSRTTLPRLQIALPFAARVVIASRAVLNGLLRSTISGTTTTHFCHESIQFILSAANLGCITIERATVIVAPLLASFTVRAIASHMTCLSADSADDTSSVVLLLRAIIFAMSDLTTVLAGLVFVVTKGSVEGREFAKLIALKLVLTFGNRCSLYAVRMCKEICKITETYSFNDIVNQLLRLIDLVLGIGHDKTMQIFFLVAGVSSVRSAFALLDGAFASNGNLGARLGFHLLERVSTRANQ
jgi:hypothetical protein